ncbi:MAG: nucleotidyl transferase AbiEii/AbiGii toxin family protein [Chloroflexota bacterium]
MRISMDCRISTAEVKLKLDINFGDPVTPEPRIVQLPSQRDSYPAVPVLGYPLETVLAEKICTAIALGEANTRVRDYADIYTLTSEYPLSYGLMRAALHATAEYRQVTLVQLSSVLGSLPTTRQSAYQAFKKRLGEAGTHLPATFNEVVGVVVAFVDPLLNGWSENLMWLPTAGHWR